MSDETFVREIFYIELFQQNIANNESGNRDIFYMKNRKYRKIFLKQPVDGYTVPVNAYGYGFMLLDIKNNRRICFQCNFCEDRLNENHPFFYVINNVEISICRFCLPYFQDHNFGTAVIRYQVPLELQDKLLFSCRRWMCKDKLPYLYRSAKILHNEMSCISNLYTYCHLCCEDIDENIKVHIRTFHKDVQLAFSDLTLRTSSSSLSTTIIYFLNKHGFVLIEKNNSFTVLKHSFDHVLTVSGLRYQNNREITEYLGSFNNSFTICNRSFISILIKIIPM
uniref:Uncharacterized protein LOC114330755 n=1 Tax=Diabrotica virgifera virgifera TaxID=50390 RepID=A0A6P7FIP5_DIAVI